MTSLTIETAFQLSLMLNYPLVWTKSNRMSEVAMAVLAHHPHDFPKSKNRRRSDVSRNCDVARSDIELSRNDIEVRLNDIEMSHSVDFWSHSVAK